MAERTPVTLGVTLEALVEGKKYTTLRDILVTMNEADIAAVIGPKKAKDLFAYLHNKA